MSHYQVIAAAYEMKGNNAYLKQNNGLDFGIRYNFYPNRERTGVVKVVEFENETTPAEQIANERIRKGLKYKIPSITELNRDKLTDRQVGFITENLDRDKMDDEISEFWNDYLTQR